MNIIGFYHEYEKYGCFCNWYKADFVYARNHFSSIEQFMMFHKVLLFGEYKLADKIMNTDDPAEIKKLGRSNIANFDAYLWDKLSYNIVKRGIRAKFLQNPDIQEILLSTGDAILVEASPRDNKWGAGISVDDDRINRPEYWTGKNLLGRILMEVREELKIHKGLNYVNALELDFPLWNEKAGELRCNPKFYTAISTYVDSLKTKHEKNCFLYQATLSDWEDAMLNNMGGGLPVIGFFELKQELYDISRMI